MKEDSKNGKPKKMGEIGFFFFITFVYIIGDIFFINQFIINQPITWHTYIITILFFFSGYFILHQTYRDFFQNKATNRLKSLILVPLITLMIISKLILIKNHGFLLKPFIIVVVTDVLEILVIWYILVRFEKNIYSFIEKLKDEKFLISLIKYIILSLEILIFVLNDVFYIKKHSFSLYLIGMIIGQITIVLTTWVVWILCEKIFYYVFKKLKTN